MLRFFQRELVERAPSQGPKLFTVPAPVIPIDRLLSAEGAPPSPLLLWDSPGTEPDGPPFSFLGWGEAARIEASGEGRFDELRRGADALFAALSERRHPDLDHVPAPRLFGGIAFRPEALQPAPWTAFRDASFVMPRWLYGTSGDRAFLRLAVGPGEQIDPDEIERTMAAMSAAHVDGVAEGSSAAPRAVPAACVERTSPADWEAMIVDALARIRAHELEKVVPAVLCRVTAASDLDVTGALARMHAAYPECTRFAFERGGAVFLGASPERLVSRRGGSVLSDALAGSRARASDPAEDERGIQALFGSDKDRREHHVVVLAIERALRPFVGAITAPDAPRIRSLRNVHHLWTPIEATLSRPTHVLDLVRALHPTPAVCGTPQKAALAWIAAHERTPRGWYAGAVGWFDASGDGSFSVAIRSGVLDRRHAFLYAGAGIVEGSDPAAEYAETRVKQAPLLTALGLLP
jgi:menaquinone-specific isochorismate synthase